MQVFGPCFTNGHLQLNLKVDRHTSTRLVLYFTFCNYTVCFYQNPVTTLYASIKINQSRIIFGLCLVSEKKVGT